MPRHVKILRVVLASPGDVQSERKKVVDVVDSLNRHYLANTNWRFEISRWEDAFPGFNSDGPQGLIDEYLQIKDCDLLICIFWKRFGTPTKGAASGTEHEFKSAFEAWKSKGQPQIMLYFCEKPYSPQTNEELDQWRRVIAFKKDVPPEGLWWTYKNNKEFESLIHRHLMQFFNNYKTSSDTGEEEVDCPEGWELVDRSFLENERRELPEQRVIKYFDGRPPGWSDVLSPHVPERAIVGELASEIQASSADERIIVTLLMGAGGEGKSTALMQTVCKIVNSDSGLRVIWHKNPRTNLPIEFLLGLPKKKGKWLIVSDEAERIADDVFQAARRLDEKHRMDFHFLLCCRESDWLGVKANQLSWKYYVSFPNPKRLSGLTLEDAEEIVKAWSRFGERGMGSMFGKDIKSAAAELVRKAREEAAKNLANRNYYDGAFLGAMLRTRVGDGEEVMQEHVADLLSSLQERAAPGGNLMKAFAYIVALHAEGKPIVSAPVLAEVCGCQRLNEVYERIIEPLAEEAATTTTSEFIFTRHQAIAEAAVKLFPRFHLNLESTLLELLLAARKIYREKKFLGPFEQMPANGEWPYLPKHFVNKGRYELAIDMAKSVLKSSHESHFFTQLSQVYRKAGRPEDSLRLFRDPQVIVNRDRAYFNEWATVEGIVSNHAIDAWLEGVTLADRDDQEMLGRYRAEVSLSGVAGAFEHLFDKSGERLFIEACGAAAQLGLRLRPNPRSEYNLSLRLSRSQREGVKEMDQPTAIGLFEKGVVKAWELREAELPNWVKKGSELRFLNLRSSLNR
jgi:hypothetical protein